MKKIVCLMLAAGITSTSQAADLMDIYRQALENDPTFKAAYSTFLSNREAIPQAFSALLPQVLVKAQVSRTRLEVAVGGGGGRQIFNSNQWQLTSSQAVFNYQAWAQVQLAKASVKAALASFNNSAQDLILRTARAYFEVLFARDTLNFAEAKLRANKRQLDQAQNRFDVGVDTITSVYEAKAAYDQSIAEVISAKNNQINQSENLRKLTNHVYEKLSPLRENKIPLLNTALIKRY